MLYCNNYNVNILGIETTCDETSVSLVKVSNFDLECYKFDIISNIILSQDIHNIFGGIYPEKAFRKHQENIIKVLQKAIEGIDINDIDLIGVSAFPGLIGALATGVAVAKTMGIILSKPVVPVNHLWGHLFANLAKNHYSINFKESFPSLGLVVSGGHTNLYLIRNFLPIDIELISRTLDDAVGEAYDKVARLLGLGFPGGPVIDKLAKEYIPENKEKPIFPVPKSKEFSYSGLKTAVMRYVKNIRIEEMESTQKQSIIKKISYYFQYSAIEHIIRKVEEVLLDYKDDYQRIKSLIVGGGVAANSLLRKKLSEISNKYNLKLYIPDIILCTDNAAMIAIASFFIYESFFKNKNNDILDFDVYPSEDEGLKIYKESIKKR